MRIWVQLAEVGDKCENADSSESGKCCIASVRLSYFSSKLDTEDDTSDNECESVNTGSPIVITATPTIDTSKRVSVRHSSLGRRSNVQ